LKLKAYFLSMFICWRSTADMEEDEGGEAIVRRIRSISVNATV
jgi:hypothetical protein